MPESSQATDASWSRALALARDALAVSPGGLLTDYDGTLSRIVPDPSAATLADGAGPALEALAQRLAVVAFVTGRAALDVRRLSGLERVLVAGNHGTELLEPGGETSQSTVDRGVIERALTEALARVPDLAGLRVEHKGLSASVHYRDVDDPTVARDAVHAALGSLDGTGLVARDGRMIVEIVPTAAGDKGTATRTIAARFGLRGLVVLGDDVTDLDMFRAADDLRAAEGVRVAIIGVGSGGEAPAEVAAAADAVVADAPAAAALLAALAAGHAAD
ncbi:MAG TPA: trehalose-phosphatase [Candidatus Limnocylindria bacterium]|nr:trehalose-phosphatase [Candidatus Limnocylindria bacterium]